MITMKTIKKILIDLIPGFMFPIATIVSIATHNDRLISFIGLILYIFAFLSLDLHTYLINKLNNKE
jgi:hypothetical protein